MESPSMIIDNIRADKFSIGPSLSKNPLAVDMHEAIRQLAAELYQKDLHFVMELIQNADDNSYAEGVIPEVGFVLVEADVAEVGVKWTLLVVNNELGFLRKNVESLCSIGQSTKKGNRASGYIGEKGIGFKSVFLITRHPIVISNGFRIQFNEAPTDNTGIGFIVPEWANKPTDAELRQCLGMSELPTTIIVLPVRDDKVQVMRDELHELSPNLVLFLNKIKKMHTRERTSLDLSRGWEPSTNQNTGMCVEKRHPTPREMEHMSGKCHPNYSVVQLSHHAEAIYHVWRQDFPIKPGHVVPERKEVEAWTITLAFPLDGASKAGTGDLFAFLPTKVKTGFPFIINADFLLVSSRESLRMDSVWNQGILSCIPDAFMAALLFLLLSLQATGSVRLIFNLIPREYNVTRDYDFIRQAIYQRLKQERIILCDSDLGQTLPNALDGSSNGCCFCCPSDARMIPAEFRKILEAAHQEGIHPPTLLRCHSFYIVDGKLQEEQVSLLRALGVTDFTEHDVISCLKSPGWLLNLPEYLYVRVLCFLSENAYLMSSHNLQDVPFLKYEPSVNTVGLLSPSQSKSTSHLYLTQLPKDQMFLSEWFPLFGRWVSAYFMPRRTKVQLGLLHKSEDVTSWLNQTANICDLSVESYAELIVYVCRHKNISDPKFAIGILHFLLKAYTDGYLNLKQCKEIFSKSPLLDETDKLRIDIRYCDNKILLPASLCSWPKLIVPECPWRQHLFVLSELYLKFPPLMANDFTAQDVSQFLRAVRGAVDLSDLLYPPNAPLAILQSQNVLTRNVVQLLLHWLSNQNVHISSQLSTCLSENHWIKTAEHGHKKPGMAILNINGEWDSWFDAKDVPFVDNRFYGDLTPYKALLEEMGMVCELTKGGTTVAHHIYELIKASALDVKSTSAARWYRYLRKCNWQPEQGCASEFRIWIPDLRQWRSMDQCVISDSTGLFGRNQLIVLDKQYKDQDILQFFEHNLKVPRRPSTVNYCQLWKEWSSTLGDVSLEEEACENIWGEIAQGWKNCSTAERASFKACYRILTNSLEMVRPGDVLYPDNLMLSEMKFSSSNGQRLKLAWYPNSIAAASWVEDLVACYKELGVKSLSEQVSEVGDIMLDSWSETCMYGQCHQGVFQMSNTRGLCRAVMGYLANPKHGVSFRARKEIVSQLSCVEFEHIDMQRLKWEVCGVRYRLEVGTQVYEAERCIRVKWDKRKRKVYVIANSVENFESELLLMREELVQELVKGVLGAERAALMEGLSSLLQLALCYDFDDDVVKVLLRLRNLRLPVEDEAFLLKL